MDLPPWTGFPAGEIKAFSADAEGVVLHGDIQFSGFLQGLTLHADRQGQRCIAAAVQALSETEAEHKLPVVKATVLHQRCLTEQTGFPIDVVQGKQGQALPDRALLLWVDIVVRADVPPVALHQTPGSVSDTFCCARQIAGYPTIVELTAGTIMHSLLQIEPPYLLRLQL